jgi:hypothetical protein
MKVSHNKLYAPYGLNISKPHNFKMLERKTRYSLKPVFLGKEKNVGIECSNSSIIKLFFGKLSFKNKQRKLQVLL